MTQTELANILQPVALVQPAKNNVICLRERQSPGMRVEIINPTGMVAVIRLEKVGHPPGIQEGPCRRICDYLLIAKYKSNNYATFVELKKTSSNEEKPKEQLRRSLPILEYLRSACGIGNAGASNEPSMIVSYWVICERNSAKLDKQLVNADPAKRTRKEQYKNITIRTFIGKKIPFARLTVG